MNMLLKISWRNIWRNRQRSSIMILAITAGLWGGLFAASLAMGLMDQRFRTGIEQEFSHVQVHHPEFIKEQNPLYSINEWENISNTLSNDENVVAFSGRTLVSGMIATANQTNGIRIIGINPEMESNTTSLSKNIIEGEYFGEPVRNPLLMGQRLADKMKAQVGSRVVLTFQDINNELVSVSCRVTGIFRTANTMFDELNVYLLQSDLNQLLGDGNIVNEVAVVIDDYRLSADFANLYSEKFPSYTIRNWAEISPQLGFYNEMGMTMFLITLIIILLALAFGLLNTMIMSVFERVRELGMLMSIGMSKKRIFLMILFETIFLTISGAVGGMIVGSATIALFKNKGLDLSAVGGDSLNNFGFEAVVYPQLEPSFFLSLTVLVMLTAIFTGIYPALKAIRLRPAEAVRAD